MNPTRTEPWRAPLLALRNALMRLHKTLLDAERLSYEIEHGPIKNNGDYLQLLIHHERFTWLQPYTKLIVAIDEAEDSKEPVSEEVVQTLWSRTRELTVTECDKPDSPYQEVADRTPEIQEAHQAVVDQLNAHG